MDEYWDSEDQWIDEVRCIGCKQNTGRNGPDICSATCLDLLAMQSYADCGSDCE